MLLLRTTKPGVESSNLSSRTNLQAVLEAVCGEAWASIPRAPGYEASSLGRIRRIGASSPLKQRETPKGYAIVDVAADGRPIRTVMVHPLVADAWIGPRPPGMTLDHLGEKSDNGPLRIEYVSNLVNQQRRWERVRQAEQLAVAA